ncbi:MAG: family 20 glycosylhydrolase [Bacteroidaceae bacterium]|nr:family 20 glycosylhydrolase [Bacteroidaceae bacterium]
MNRKTILSALLFVLCFGRVAAQPLCIPDVQEIKPAQGTVEAAKFTTVAFDNASLQNVAEYLGKAWGIPTAQQKKGTDTSIFLSLLPQKEAKKLGDEGYRLTISPKGITIQAITAKGALWGTQTLLQLNQTYFTKNEAGVRTRGFLPCGTITDKPDYPMRGMMLDVGRKFFPMSYLYSLVNILSYYKMNTLQLHLNDNGFKDQYNDSWDEAYAAFRMESDVFPGLTAIDGSYSKQEMRDFIRYAETMGVEIIPEFDAPAHSLAFTHYRPSLASEEFGADHLDLRNPEVIPFLDSLYAEFLGGPDPVFTCPRFHIGTDEYSNKDSAICERFRELIVHLCNTVKSYGKQPVFWGSLTHAKGVTPVPSDGVLMSLWYNGYADPVEMHKQGFHMISIPDAFIYIVPAAGYYNDYLNTKWLFQHWNPSLIRNKRFDHQDPLIDGGMFALWNDFIKNGISVGDSHDRILPAMQVISEKCWNALRDSTDAAFDEWQTLAKKLEDGPLTDEIGRKSMVNHIDLKPKSTIYSEERRVKSEESKLQSGTTGYSNSSLFTLHSSLIHQIGYPYIVEFTIDWADEKPGTVLCTSERSTFYLSDPIKGMLGFSRDGYLFTFKYKGKPGKRETIQLKGDNKGISLYADGKLVENLKPDTGHRTDSKKSTYKIMRTLVFPLQETGDFRSKITNFSAWR